jgi:ABC-type amino acid transport substrate-binding protein
MHRLIKQFITLNISICIALLFNLNVVAEESNAIRFDILRSYPFAYIDNNGNKVGTYWEYIDEIVDKSGVNISKRIVPKARIIANLKSGQSDAAILFKTDSLNDHVEYIAKVRTIPILLATQKGVRVESYEDLKSLSSVGVFRSGSINPAFDNDASINKHLISNYPSMVKMLGSKRLDAITGNGVVITALINQLCLHELIDISPLIMGSREQWLVFSKKSAHLNKTENIKNAVQQLQQEGVLDQIFDAHVYQNKQSCDQGNQ